MRPVLRSWRGTRVLRIRLATVLCPVLASGCGVPSGAPTDTMSSDAAAQDSLQNLPDDRGSDASILETGRDVFTVETGPDVLFADAFDAFGPLDVIDAARADTADATAPDVPLTVDPRLLGTFHLGTDVEYVLVIESDGTFRWRRTDCVASDNDCGRWRGDGTDIVLSPSPGRSTFDWFATSFRESATTARVTVGTAPGDIVIRGMIGARSLRPFEQAWTTGRVCAACSDAGASGPAVECTTPVPACTP